MLQAQKRTFPLIVALFLLARGSSAGAELPPLGKAIKLFDGRNLDHFDIYIPSRGLNPASQPIFSVRDGIINATGEEYAYIITKEEFGNYYLRAEFKWGNETHEPRKNKARDSGILLHVSGENMIWPSSIEYQFIEGGTGDILVVNGPALTVNGERKTRGRFDRFGKGAWKDEAGYRDPNGDPENPHGEWNVVEYLAHGDRIRYWLNGKLINEGSQSTVSKGRILFQSEGAEVYFRNIEVRPLKR